MKLVDPSGRLSETPLTPSYRLDFESPVPILSERVSRVHPVYIPPGVGVDREGVGCSWSPVVVGGRFGPSGLMWDRGCRLRYNPGVEGLQTRPTPTQSVSVRPGPVPEGGLGGEVGQSPSLLPDVIVLVNPVTYYIVLIPPPSPGPSPQVCDGFCFVGPQGIHG